MKKFTLHTGPRSRGAATLIEVMIASTAFTVVLGAILMGFSMFSKNFTLARDYGMARLTLSDYINLDLKRSTDFFPTLVPNVTHGGWVADDWTLPMAFYVTNYNKTDGTPNEPARVSMTAAELAAAQETAIARGRLAPLTWKIAYGSAATPRLVVYEQVGKVITRRDGWGTVTRPTANTISWTWSGGTPFAAQVAQGVIKIQGVYKVTSDLTPEDFDEPPPDDVMTAFKGNYSIQYTPSVLTKVTTQVNSIINSNVLLRTQVNGF